MKEALELVLKEQEKTQKELDKIHEVFKEVKKGDTNYNKIASEYYYRNGMNNELIIIRNLIQSEMNK